MKDDYASLYRGWERTAESMRTALTKLPGVEAEIFVPEIANQCPHVRARWDSAKYKISPPDLMQKLRDGEPSIELVPAAERGRDDRDCELDVAAGRSGSDLPADCARVLSAGA